MATNPYFSNYQGEQNLVESITIEVIKTMGLDCIYIPREYLSIDKIFGEDPGTSFKDSYTVEMYLQSYKGFDGTDIVTQFGIEIKDRVNLILSRKRFYEEVTTKKSSITRPREGDLIYFPLSKSLFEINFVEHENPFYPLGKLYSYSITAELFTYSYEKMKTLNSDINSVYNTTHGFSGSTIIPLNNGLGTTAGNNDDLSEESEEYLFDSNNPYVDCDTPLPTPTSSLDYEVFAALFVTIQEWNTPQYNQYSIVPMIPMNTSVNNGYRSPGDTTAQYFKLSEAVNLARTIPESRRVGNNRFIWEEMSSWTTVKHDYYTKTSDGYTYGNCAYLSIWTDNQYNDVTDFTIAALEQLRDEEIQIPYFSDDKENLDPVYTLRGYNSYWPWSGNSPAQFDANGNPTSKMPYSYAPIYPDARRFAAIIADPRFNNFVNPQTGKSVAGAFLDYYKILSNQYSLTATAEEVLSIAAGITAYGDFPSYGYSRTKQYSYYGPGDLRNSAQLLDSELIVNAWQGALREFVYGYYATRSFMSALAGVTYFSGSTYSNYAMTPIGITEAFFTRDSNNYIMLEPEYPNQSGGKALYGNNGNIIYNTFSSFISGYVLNPTNDYETYTWQGHNSAYSGGGTLVRYANDNSNSTLWSKQVSHKQFIDDVKYTRHMFRTKPDYWKVHNPWVSPRNYYSSFYDGARYFYEIMYHTILHGCMYISHFEEVYDYSRGQILHNALDEWRTISNNSKAIPCSNSTGDVNSIVDRIVMHEAVTKFVMSGGRLINSGKYLWRITLGPQYFDSNGVGVLRRTNNDLDIPYELVIDTSDAKNGRGAWVLRNISTPPSYEPVTPET